MRNTILCHISALECWNMGIADLVKPASRTVFQRSAYRTSDLPEDLGFALGISTPVHLLVPRDAQRSNARGLVHHAWTRKLPPAPFYNLTAASYLGASAEKPRIYLASPALSFMQVTARRSLAEALLMGLELCGHYTTLTKDGRFASRPPITSAHVIRSAIETVYSSTSHAKLVVAGKYLADGSRSPAESRLYLLLCLPRRLGGWGLPAPELNGRVPVPADIAWRIGRDYYECDLLFRASKLVIEYDSREHHLDEEQRIKDSQKRMDLKRLGYTVLEATERQLRFPVPFCELAEDARRILGVRKRGDTEAALRARERLRKELLDFRKDLYH